jgi:hypothetical protein
MLQRGDKVLVTTQHEEVGFKISGKDLSKIGASDV